MRPAIFLLKLAVVALLALGALASARGESAVQQFADLAPGPAGSDPDAMVAVGDSFFFTADDGVHGRELWRSDGTQAGTAMIKDIDIGADGSDPRHLTAFDGLVYFAASAGADNAEIWRSDGTITGTVAVSNLNLDATERFESFSIAVGRLFVQVDVPETETTPAAGEFWAVPAGAPNAVRLASLPNAALTPIVELNGAAYFFATTVAANQWTAALWRSDGSQGGTASLGAMANGPGNNPAALTPPVAASGRIFSVIPQNGVLFGGNGTIDDMSGIATLPIGQYTAGEQVAPTLTAFRDRMFITPPYGGELWISDGSASGTMQIKDINPGAPQSNPQELTVAGEYLFFTADDGTHGRELWRSDGSPNGTLRVTDLAPRAANADPHNLRAVQGQLYFAADDGTRGAEAYRADCQGLAAEALDEIAAGAIGADPANFAPMGGAVAFAADDGNSGTEPWAFRPAGDNGVEIAPLSGAPIGGIATVRLFYTNETPARAETTTITATLADQLEYLGSTAPVTPTVNGRSLTWTLPGGPAGCEKGFLALQVRMPAGDIGTRFAVSFAIAPAGGETDLADNAATAQIMLARQMFWPLIGR